MNIAQHNGAVPANIARIISEKGLKQGAIARKAGFKDHQLTDILKGRKLLRVNDIIALSDALNVDVIDLFAQEPPTTARPGA